MSTRELFEAELRRRGIAFDIDPASGRHSFDVGGTKMLISLSNLDRDLARDGDQGRVARFVDAILSAEKNNSSPLSPSQLFWSLEPRDHAEPADFRSAISEKVDRVLVHLSPDQRLISWVTPSMLDSLGLSESDAAARGFANLAQALSDATLTIENIDGVSLGMLATKMPSKSAMILAPNLREVVGDRIGWPVMAVLPDRDFLYLWPAKHKEFASRLGGVVVREFERASYPLSTEVYEVAQEQIRAIGEFPTKPPAVGNAADSVTMKTVNYRGGVVRFRIPSDWQEEYEEAGGGTFYKQGEDTGTLRLNVMTFEAPQGRTVGSESVEELLRPDSVKYSATMRRLGPNVGMIQYDQASVQGHDRLKIRYWQLAQALPPRTARIIVFSYTLLEKQFNTPAFEAELNMLGREVTACELA